MINNTEKIEAIKKQVALIHTIIAQERETIRRLTMNAQKKVDNILLNRIPGLEQKINDYINQLKELMA